MFGIVPVLFVYVIIANCLVYFSFLGHGICDNVARASNMLAHTDNSEKIYQECANLLKQLKVAPEDVRGVR